MYASVQRSPYVGLRPDFIVRRICFFYFPDIILSHGTTNLLTEFCLNRVFLIIQSEIGVFAIDCIHVCQKNASKGSQV